MDLIAKQKELMKVLGVTTDKVSPHDQLFKNILHCLAIEVGEAASPLLVATKPWKEEMQDFSALDEEIIDVLFFWLEIASFRGWTWADVEAMYEKKWSKNINRVAVKKAEAEIKKEVGYFHKVEIEGKKLWLFPAAGRNILVTPTSDINEVKRLVQA